MKRVHFALLTMAAVALCSCATSSPQPTTATASPAASPAATPSTATTADLEKTVIDLEKKMWELAKHKQVEEYRKMLAPDFRGVRDEGIGDRDKAAQSVLLGEIREYALSDVNVTFPNPDTAVTTYKCALKGTFKGADTSGNYHSSAVWVKQGGEWRNLLYTEVKVALAK